ncbi:MAG TPA: hypothetical protein VGP72_08805 [Planctomycetota bacterium]|jgi:MraZ protein
MSETNTISPPSATTAPRRATFYGVFYREVSGRNQVAIPKVMKRAIDDAHEDQLLLMRWQNEPNLRLYTKNEFDTKLEQVKRKPTLSEEQKSTAIALLARSCEPIEPDSQGRFVLPGRWIDALNIRGEVAFCASHTHIEIWPAEQYREAEKGEQGKLSPVSAEVTSVLNP